MVNGERSYEPEEITNDKLVDFSEGCEELYQLLKYCFDNKIGTYACCKGHNDEKQNNKPYILFIVTNENQMAQLINQLMNSPLSNQIECSYQGNDKKTLAIYCDDLMFREVFFEHILKSLELYNHDLDSNYNVIYKLYDMYRTRSSHGASISVREDKIVIFKHVFAYFHCEGNQWIRTPKKVDGSFGQLFNEDVKQYSTDTNFNDINVITDQELFDGDLAFPYSISIKNEDVLTFYDKARQCINHKHI